MLYNKIMDELKDKFCNFCGKPAIHRFKTGKKSYCCETHFTKCPAMRKQMSLVRKNRKFSNEHIEKLSEAKKNSTLSQEHKNNISKALIGHKGWNKDIKQTEESNRKRSESMKGKNTWMKGRTQTPESNKKRSLKLKGRKGKSPNLETKNKISIGLKEFYKDKKGTMYGVCGPDHPSWKGGIAAEPYCDIWIDRDYKKDVKSRDNHSCQNPDCWHTTDHLSLCLHHIDYNKLNCHPWNLITVCFSCNARANKDRENWTKFYQQIMLEKHGYKYK